jgi:hypothetical protein
MKKYISILSMLGGFAILVAGALILNSCEGPQGPPGLDGEDGIDGINGVDANETCIVCHNNEVVLLAKQQQALSSHHLTGGNYARNHADCAICHTHQGFIETIESNALEASGDIENPAPINCRTCHMIHTNYDEGDWTLTTSSAVDLDYGGQTVDMGGSSNLCVNCHQIRPLSPDPVLGGADVTITSSRWGPHHGPQGNNIWGVGGYEIAGSKTYPAAGSHAHADAGCTTCHMAAIPYGGPTAGGHTFNMTYTYHSSVEENLDACTSCHTTLEEFDHNGVMTEVEDLISQIDTIFMDKGWISEPGGTWEGTPFTVTADEAGAMLNYLIVLEDKSMGVHNPPYIIALLTNTIESLE